MFVALLVIYGLASFLLLLYGINAYLMIYYSFSERGQNLWKDRDPGKQVIRWPPVTVQLPIYNEKNVAERIIRAAASMAYPLDRLEIQVLDDSTEVVRKAFAALTTNLQPPGY